MKPRTIVITGASRGIGKELVHQLAEYSGHRILALSRNVDRMETEFEDLENVSCHAFDLSRDDVKEQTEKILSTVKTVDILINNAGYLVNKPFSEITHNDFITSYKINVTGVMETVQGALPKMNDAHIVNISSVGGYQGSVKFPGLTAYSTSKAALCSFTELFAEEFKESDIAMNCLCLGAAQTEMLEAAFPGYQAPVSAAEMAEFIADFSLNAKKWMRGKIIPVSLSTP
ncbi:MAG: SDR family oxidoreductase [bacterium]|nr:SDR family oxidoreductase [bacterium]